MYVYMYEYYTCTGAIRMYVCMYVCMNIYTGAARMYVCMYVHMYEYVYTGAISLQLLPI